MSSYLLLRDNKQTGPFSLEDLLKTGFKKYDLVWVEGKSAAWRYPCEIGELKAFAPVVEEQPFDRFYKKASEAEKKKTEPLTISEPKQRTARVEQIYPVSSKPVVLEMGEKKIYASLPFNNRKQAAPEKTMETAAPSQTYYRQTIQREDAFSFGLTNTETVKEGPTFRKKAGNPFHIKIKSGSYLVMAVVGAVVIAILAAGIFIGMRISKSSGTNQSDVHNAQSLVSNESRPSQSQTAALIETKHENKDQGLNTNRENNAALVKTETSSETSSEESTLKNNPAQTETHKSSKAKANASHIPDPALAINKKAPLATDSAITVQGYSKRQSQHRGDILSDKPAAITDISSMVSISANKYNIGTFGGLSDIQLTVNNKSEHALDLVLVEVQYVLASKKIYKTENLYYRNLGPGESIMQEAPKSSRGIKILYRVTVVNSKDASVSFSGI